MNITNLEPDASGSQFTAQKGHTDAVLIQATPEKIRSRFLQLGLDRAAGIVIPGLRIFFLPRPSVYELKPELHPGLLTLVL
jgi:hypothetical protein